MGIEIERKFLVGSDAWRRRARRRVAMRQGYLCDTGGKASVRVRIEGRVAHLNIKGAVVGRRRAEYDYRIPIAEARELLDTLCVGRVEKLRHYVTSGPHTWEIDEFGGDNAGLVVAEIELRRVDESFVTPAWLGREVTDERRYYNHSLALHPYSRWPASERA
jgi:adenylate cyclase